MSKIFLNIFWSLLFLKQFNVVSFQEKQKKFCENEKNSVKMNKILRT